MMCERLLNIPELKYLWKSRGNKNYNFKGFLTNDGTSVNYILLEDLQNRRKVFGKVVKDSREGEAYHWPRLQHENIAPLLETVSLNEKVCIYILPAIGFNLKNVIHDESFKTDSESFNRKRNYVKDILLALDYLHSKSLCVLNLTERIFCVSDVSDKAVLYDFQSVHLTARVTKQDLDLPILYQAPELKTELFDPIATEAWACGVMFLQIFTNDVLPSAFIGEEVKSVLQAVKETNYGIIKEACSRADINFSMITELQSFLSLFLVEDPKLRTNIRNAVASTFLKNSRIVELNNDFKSTLWKSSNPFAPSSAFEVDSSHKKSLLPPFEAIYLKEKANCRDKLKQIPCTNKFINLKFIPHGDSTTKHLDKSRSRKNEKVGVSDQNKEKFIAEQTRSSELHSVDKQKGSLIGDSKTMPRTPECAENLKSSSNTGNSNTEDKSIGDNKIIPTAYEFAENFKCSRTLNKTNDSNLEMTSSNFGGVTENVEVFYDSIFAPHKMDDVIKSSNRKNVNETENSEAKLQTGRSASDSNVSLDSLELCQNELEQASENSREQEFISHGSNKSSDSDLRTDTNTDETLCAPEDKTSLCLKTVYLNSVFKIKGGFEQNLLNDTQSFDDSCTRSSTYVKDNDLDSYLSVENNNEDNHQSHEIERKHKSEILMLEANIEAEDTITPNNQELEKPKKAITPNNQELEEPKNAITPNNQELEEPKNAIMPNNQKLEEPKNVITPNNQELEELKDALTCDDVDLHSDKNGEIKTGGHHVDESAKKDEIEKVSFKSFQNVQQIDHKLCKNNYGEMATTSGTTKDEARIHTEETKLKVGKKRSFLKIPFTRKKSPVAKKNAKNVSSTSIKDKSKSYEIERNYESEILKLEENVEAFSQNNVLDDAIMPSYQVLGETKDALTYNDVDLLSKKNGKIKTGSNLLNFDESAKEDKIEKVSFNNFQNAQQIHRKLFRNNSYKISVKRDTVKDEAGIPTEETKLKVGKKKSFLKIPFIHKKFPAAKNNVENYKIETEKIRNNLSVLSNEDNVRVSQNVTNMKERLLEPPPVEKIKRKWIRFFLCPGGK